MHPGPARAPADILTRRHRLIATAAAPARPRAPSCCPTRRGWRQERQGRSGRSRSPAARRRQGSNDPDAPGGPARRSTSPSRARPCRYAAPSQASAMAMACRARPTPAPTTVPLIRMNCRSRPSSSSSWVDVCVGVPALDGARDQAGQLVVELVGERPGARLDHALEALLQPRSPSRGAARPRPARRPAGGAARSPGRPPGCAASPWRSSTATTTSPAARRCPARRA